MMVEMFFIFGLAVGFIVGILIGASLSGNSNNRGHISRSSSDHVRRYMNNPVVEELNEQAQTKNLP